MKNNDGFLMLEIMFICLIVIATIGIFNWYILANYKIGHAENVITASCLAREQIEQLKNKELSIKNVTSVDIIIQNEKQYNLECHMRDAVENSHLSLVHVVVSWQEKNHHLSYTLETFIFR